MIELEDENGAKNKNKLAITVEVEYDDKNYGEDEISG